MPRRSQKLLSALMHTRPDLDDPIEAIGAGRVMVDGRVVTNPRSLVMEGSSITVSPRTSLRGTEKLRAALSAFAVEVRDRIALDVGAAAGGFTQALLEAGAGRVYALDAGHGQLLGSLRQDRRVVNLEATNLAELDSLIVPEEIDLVTVDVSYLSLTDALPQLAPVRLSASAQLIALVKPMFELHRDRPPTDPTALKKALYSAWQGAEDAGWTVMSAMRSPITGAKGAVEFFLNGRLHVDTGAQPHCLGPTRACPMTSSTSSMTPLPAPWRWAELEQ